MLNKKYLLALAGMIAFASPATAQGEPELNSTMVWTTLDVGSSGHAEASAVADALMKNHNVRVRIRPAGSSPARILPLRSGQASHGFLANEAYFAAEAIEGFEDRSWGPQDLRTIMARPAVYGIVTTNESGIETLSDIRGKRFAYVVGQPGINVKNDALLAYAGLTKDEVEIVEMPNYPASIRALAEGRADVAGSVPTAGVLRELEASPNGLKWVKFGEGEWSNLEKVVPFFTKQTWTMGPGLSESEPGDFVGYRYPILTVYAEADADEVYALTKAVLESADDFKGALAGMENYVPAQVGLPPVDTAFHEGAIRYFKEAGVWTDEHDAWNEARIARHKALQDAWAHMMESDAASLNEKDFAKAWAERRVQVIQGLQ